MSTSQEMYNRILWDSDYNENDYVIGYIDRKKGSRKSEVALTKFKVDVTSDGFIPWHRVIYIRQLSTGKEVWKRN